MSSTATNSVQKLLQDRLCMLKRITEFQLAFRKVLFDEQTCSLKKEYTFDTKMMEVCLSAPKMEASLSFLRKHMNDPASTEMTATIDFLSQLDRLLGEKSLDQIYIDHFKMVEDFKKTIDDKLDSLSDEMNRDRLTNLEVRMIQENTTRCTKIKEALNLF